MKLKREHGDYYTQDGQYKIEKGCWGWNIYEREERRFGLIQWQYLTTTETLREARETVAGA